MLRNTDKSSHFPKKILSDIIMADEEIKIPVVSPRKSIQELEKSMIFNKDIKMNEDGKGGLFWECHKTESKLLTHSFSFFVNK